MFLTTLTAAIVMGAPVAGDVALTCPMMGSPVAENAAKYEYAGAELAFCCAGCDTGFGKDPEAAFKKLKGSEKAAANFLFDPVSHNAIKPAKAEHQMVMDGIRYSFENAKNLEAFKADPVTHTKRPKKESWNCPVMGEAVASLSKASGYMDHAGVRYYFCCAGCATPFAKDPAKYAANAKGVRDVQVVARKS